MDKKQVHDYFEKVWQTIDTYGLAVIGVEGSENCTIFSHTIGLKDKWGIELLMEAVPLPVAKDLLNQIAFAARDQGMDISKPTLLTNFLTGSMRLALVPVPDSVKETHTYHVELAYEFDRQNTDYTVMQVVLCDPHGRMPWEGGYANAPFIKVYGELPKVEDMQVLDCQHHAAH